MVSQEVVTIKRRLYAWEIEEARRVFGNQLNYDRIWIHEHSWLPIWIEQAARFLRPDHSSGEPIAITIGYHCLFPERLLIERVNPSYPEHYKIAWLIHELTHVWQYQRIGWNYLIKALILQLSEGISAYYYGGASGLMRAFESGKNLADFNLEQQGEISRAYYNRLVRNHDISAWQPFIEELKKA